MWSCVCSTVALGMITGMVSAAEISSNSPPDAATLFAAIKKLRQIHKPLGKPGPGDWLSAHVEPGQTFREYLRERTVRLDEQRRVLYIQPLGEFNETQRRIITVTAEFTGIFYQRPAKVTTVLPLSLVPAQARRRHPSWGAPFLGQ